MLTVDLAARATQRKNAPPALSRCGSWHGSSGTCPCQLDRLAEPRAGTPTSVPRSVADMVRERGRELDEPTRRRMQDRLGHDFGVVRVHDDEQAAASARAVDAVAYTVGEHVVLDPGRLPSTPSERDAVLAHELVHTVQQGPLGNRRLPDQVSRPGDPHERAAHRAAGSTNRIAASAPPATVHRAPPADVDTPAGLSLSIREDGRLEAVVRGPKMPIVGQPAAGLRRNPDGTYTVVFGADSKVVAPSEIPPMLRGMVAGAAKGDTAPKSFRIPSCASLRSVDGTRWMTYDEYRVTQMLSPGLMPLTPVFYRGLIDRCSTEHTQPSTAPQAQPAAAPPVPAPPPVPATPPVPAAPVEALPPLVPEGQALA